jgi:hypothetical protein
MENNISICCKTDCPHRMECAKFARALDVNSGKITSGYYIVDKCEYEK